MADFCTKCSTELFGEELKPEIDIKELAEKLKPGMMFAGLLCEGCKLTAICKTVGGEIKVGYIDKAGWEANEEINSIINGE